MGEVIEYCRHCAKHTVQQEYLTGLVCTACKMTNPKPKAVVLDIERLVDDTPI